MSQGEGPKYEINIEGTIYPWDIPTITVPQLRALAGFPADQQILEIDLATNEEQTLPAGAVIELQPGKGYAKKVRYQRG